LQERLKDDFLANKSVTLEEEKRQLKEKEEQKHSEEAEGEHDIEGKGDKLNTEKTIESSFFDDFVNSNIQHV